MSYKITITVKTLLEAAAIEEAAKNNGGTFKLETLDTKFGKNKGRNRYHKVTPQGIAHVKNTIKQYPNDNDERIANRVTELGYSKTTINRIRNGNYDSKGRPKYDSTGKRIVRKD